MSGITPDFAPISPDYEPPKLPVNEKIVEKLILNTILSRELQLFTLIRISKGHNFQIANFQFTRDMFDESDVEEDDDEFFSSVIPENETFEGDDNQDHGSVIGFLLRKGKYLRRIEVRTRTRIKLQIADEANITLLICGESEKQTQRARRLFLEVVKHWESEAKKQLKVIRSLWEDKRRKGDLCCELISSRLPFLCFKFEVDGETPVDWGFAKFCEKRQIDYQGTDSRYTYTRNTPKEMDYCVSQLPNCQDSLKNRTAEDECLLKLAHTITNYISSYGLLFFHASDLTPTGLFSHFTSDHQFDLQTGALVRLSSRGELKVQRQFPEIFRTNSDIDDELSFANLVGIIRLATSSQRFQRLRKEPYSLQEYLEFDGEREIFSPLKEPARQETPDFHKDYFLVELMLLTHCPSSIKDVEVYAGSACYHVVSNENFDWDSFDEVEDEVGF